MNKKARMSFMIVALFFFHIKALPDFLKGYTAETAESFFS